MESSEEKKEIQDQLQTYRPFLTMDDTALLAIADVVEEIELKKNDVLFEMGSDDDHCYLLKSGTLVLEASDGKQTLVEEGSSRAEWPIASLKPRKFKAMAKKDAVIYVVKEEAIATAKQSHSAPASDFTKDNLPSIEMTEVSWGQLDVGGKTTIVAEAS